LSFGRPSSDAGLPVRGPGCAARPAHFKIYETVLRPSGQPVYSGNVLFEGIFIPGFRLGLNQQPAPTAFWASVMALLGKTPSRMMASKSPAPRSFTGRETTIGFFTAGFSKYAWRTRDK